MNENDKQAEPVAVDRSGLIKRIDAAIERVTKGWGLMTIPADPRSDVDLVLSECKALLQGESPPFWATDFHPAVVINDQLLSVARKIRSRLICETEIESELVVELVAAIAAAEAERAKGGV